MKLSKSLLGAILIGITVQSTSCVKEDELPGPESEQKGKKEKGEEKIPYDCPGCGMG